MAVDKDAIGEEGKDLRGNFREEGPIDDAHHIYSYSVEVTDPVV